MISLALRKKHWQFLPQKEKCYKVDAEVMSKIPYSRPGGRSQSSWTRWAAIVFSFTFVIANRKRVLNGFSYWTECDNRRLFDESIIGLDQLCALVSVLFDELRCSAEYIQEQIIIPVHYDLWYKFLTISLVYLAWYRENITFVVANRKRALNGFSYWRECGNRRIFDEHHRIGSIMWISVCITMPHQARDHPKYIKSCYQKSEGVRTLLCIVQFQIKH